MIFTREKDRSALWLAVVGYIGDLQNVGGQSMIRKLFDELLDVCNLPNQPVPEDFSKFIELLVDIQEKFGFPSIGIQSVTDNPGIENVSLLHFMEEELGLDILSKNEWESSSHSTIAIITGGLCGLEYKVYDGESVRGTGHHLTKAYSKRKASVPTADSLPLPVITIINLKPS